MQRDEASLAHRVMERSTRFLAYLGGAVLMGLMFLTVVAVVMRYAFNAPILGAQDVSELSLVVVVFLGLPYCGWTGGHVAVDLISSVVSEQRLRITDALTRFLGAILFVFLAWQTMDQAFDAIELGGASNLVEIPHYPFLLLVAFCSLLYGLVLLMQAVAYLSRHSGGQAS
jgi:TRAP-type transport system small permease protein